MAVFVTCFTAAPAFAQVAPPAGYQPGWQVEVRKTGPNLDQPAGEKLTRFLAPTSGFDMGSYEVGIPAVPNAGIAYDAEGQLNVASAGLHRVGVQVAWNDADSDDEPTCSLELAIEDRVVAQWQGPVTTDADQRAPQGNVALRAGLHPVRLKVACDAPLGARLKITFLLKKPSQSDVQPADDADVVHKGPDRPAVTADAVDPFALAPPRPGHTARRSPPIQAPPVQASPVPALAEAAANAAPPAKLVPTSVALSDMATAGVPLTAAAPTPIAAPAAVASAGERPTPREPAAVASPAVVSPPIVSPAAGPPTLPEQAPIAGVVIRAMPLRRVDLIALRPLALPNVRIASVVPANESPRAAPSEPAPAMRAESAARPAHAAPPAGSPRNYAAADLTSPRRGQGPSGPQTIQPASLTPRGSSPPAKEVEKAAALSAPRRYPAIDLPFLKHDAAGRAAAPERTASIAAAAKPLKPAEATPAARQYPVIDLPFLRHDGQPAAAAQMAVASSARATGGSALARSTKSGENPSAPPSPRVYPEIDLPFLKHGVQTTAVEADPRTAADPRAPGYPAARPADGAREATVSRQPTWAALEMSRPADPALASVSWGARDEPPQVATIDLTIREQPNTLARRIGFVNNGQSVMVAGPTADPDWVRLAGGGFVQARFLKPSANVGPPRPIAVASQAGDRGNACRPYQLPVVADGRQMTVSGMICPQANGTWRFFK